MRLPSTMAFTQTVSSNSGNELLLVISLPQTSLSVTLNPVTHALCTQTPCHRQCFSLLPASVLNRFPCSSSSVGLLLIVCCGTGCHFYHAAGWVYVTLTPWTKLVLLIAKVDTSRQLNRCSVLLFDRTEQRNYLYSIIPSCS